VALSSGATLRVAERRAGHDPLVLAHPEEFVPESGEGAKTPEQLAQEEAVAGERLMRASREASGYYASAEVGREVTVTPKERLVYVGEDRYLDVGRGTEICKQGEIMDAADPRLAALPPEHVRKFEAVFGPDGAVA
jgi:hypothetical protein